MNNNVCFSCSSNCDIQRVDSNILSVNNQLGGYIKNKKVRRKTKRKQSNKKKTKVRRKTKRKQSNKKKTKTKRKQKKIKNKNKNKKNKKK